MAACEPSGCRTRIPALVFSGHTCHVCPAEHLLYLPLGSAGNVLSGPPQGPCVLCTCHCPEGQTDVPFEVQHRAEHIVGGQHAFAE